MDNVIIYDAIDGVLNECETVMGGVNNIQGTLANGVVKSVQRGTAEHIVANTNSNFTIPINSIDLQRSILIANIEHLGNNAAPYTTAFVNNNGTAIVVKNSYGSSGITLSISWQVIEFY